MRLNRLFLASLTAALFFASCDNNDDQDAPLGTYDNGILVLNEGGLGTVTYVSQDLATVQQDIFGLVNGDDNDLGAYTQSMFFDGNRAFVISNGSNKITVVNRYSFEFIATISTGFQVPRYGVVYNGKAYVTNSNSFADATDDFISVIDLATLSVETPIAVNNKAEKIVEENGKLYVSGGFYGEGNLITVINASTKSIVTTINVGESPNSMEEKDGVLYVLCGSYTNTSKLVRVNLSDNSIASEVTFPESMGNAANLDIENNKLYFSVGAKVYKIELNAATISDAPIFTVDSTEGYTGYGFAVKNDRVYISDPAGNFSSDGSIFIYNTSGTFVQEIPVGLGPNGIYFNN